MNQCTKRNNFLPPSYSAACGRITCVPTWRIKHPPIIKKRVFCAVSALFLKRLSPSCKDNNLIDNGLKSRGDSDRCFENFLFFQMNSDMLAQSFPWREYGGCNPTFHVAREWT